MNTNEKAPMRAWDRMFGWKRRREAASTLRRAAMELRPGASVLDIGCGMGYALDVLAEDYGATAFGCDVVEPSDGTERFTRFDGRNLPFADKSVDMAMLIFVLHHADDPSVLLLEASRVAREAVLVVEDTPTTAFDVKWGSMHIRSFSKRHGIPWSGKIRTEEEWRQLFHFWGLELKSAHRLKRFERLPPVSRTAFVLQPRAVTT